MRSIIPKKLSNINYAKIKDWGKLITVVGSAQLLIQLLGIISGVVIIRLLPTKEYAFYTIANTVLGTMTILADGGIATGVMAQGGKVWQDRKKLGVIQVTGFALRKRFGLISIVITMPLLFILLTHHGATILTTSLIILCIIPSFLAALSDSLFEVPPKLNQNIVDLQKNQLIAGIGRFLLITGSLFLFPWTFIAILGNGIPRAWANIKLKQISARYADPLQKTDSQVKKDILKVVKRTLPGSIYFCISGQVSIWLISLFGSTVAIANIGALSRLTAVLTIVTVVYSILVVPRFARLEENPALLIKRFLQLQLVLLAISGLVIGFVYIFSAQILWILGKSYQGLTKEVTLISISACISMISSITYSVIAARGWVIKSIIYIPVNIIMQLILIRLLDLSKMVNVLIFSIADFSFGLLILIIYFIYIILVIKRNHLPRKPHTLS